MNVKLLPEPMRRCDEHEKVGYAWLSPESERVPVPEPHSARADWTKKERVTQPRAANAVVYANIPAGCRPSRQKTVAARDRQ